MALSDQIRTRRLAQGLTLAELARRAEVSKGYLSQLENSTDTPRPSADILYRIAFALGASVGELLEKQLPRTVEELTDVPAGLRMFAQQAHLSDDDIKMLAQIKYRGARPQSPDDYRFIYESIRRTIELDQRDREQDQDDEPSGRE
jgi:transcriptional regulator with XRE-family HTH domain